MPAPESTDVDQTLTNVSEDKYFKSLHQISIKDLSRMIKLEWLLIVLQIVSMVVAISVFFIINFEGVRTIQPLVELDYKLWRDSIRQGYYLLYDNRFYQ